jgi:hypothetical protein
VTYEHSAWRAVSAGLELRAPPPVLAGIGATRIGISSGTMRTGAYGSTSRRTYGVLGDPVNLAARLMEHASPGQVLASGEIQAVTADAFSWEKLAPLELKGKAQAVPVFGVLSSTEQTGTQLMARQYALPMVGRQAQLATLEAKLALVEKGSGQVVWVTAEAGMGKSRLVAECFKISRERGFSTQVGQCQAHGTNAPYLVWQGIWRSLFGLTADTDGRVVAELARSLNEIDPALLPRLPLLGAVLNIKLPENDLTQPMEAKLRKTSLHALLVSCLRRLAKRQPLLLVIEDRHWIDALSQEWPKSFRSCCW